jgi:uncharacterized membrane protein
MGRAQFLKSGMGWLAAGAAASYFFDGLSGRRRRSRVIQKLRSMERRAEVGLGRGVRDLANRAQGTAAELGAGLRDEHPPDEVVAARVRARIGRLVARPHAVCTSVKDGRVTLTGAIRDGERAALLGGLAAVRGVCDLDDHLEEREDGPARPVAGMRFRWTPAMRLLAGAVGGFLTGWAARRRLRLLELAGMYTALRAVRPPVSQLTFHKTLHVRAPIEAVFYYYSDFRNFPRFMNHVRHVRILDAERSHWVVEGPAGVPVEWDARITELDPNRLLAWRSEGDAPIHLEGRAQFIPEDGGTRLEIQLAYRPPAGALGHWIASLFGRDPKHELDADLLRFKSLLEEGKATAHGQTVRREDLLH